MTATAPAVSAHWREEVKKGGTVDARIITTSSAAGLFGNIGQGNYAAAKAGIAALTVATARGCARYGVRANAICPRARTAMTAAMMSPPPEEARWSAEHIEKETRRYAELKTPPEESSKKALASVCQMLMATNEFLYVE